MPKYLLLAINGPKPDGDEQAYNDWYDNIHVPDLEALDGVVSATRYRIIRSRGVDHPYVAAYEIETDDIEKLFVDMETRPRPFDPNFDRSTSSFVLAERLTPDKKG